MKMTRKLIVAKPLPKLQEPIVESSTIATFDVIERSLVISEDPTGKKLMVAKANKLIDSRHVLSLNGNKLYLYSLSLIYRKGEELQTYRIYAGHWLKAIGSKKTSGYTEFKRLFEKELMNNVVDLPTDTGYVLYPLYIKAEGYRDHPWVDIQFHPELKSLLLGLRKNFTSFDITYVLGFSHNTTIRLYQVLKSFEGLKVRTIGLDDLRRMLNIQGKYETYDELNRQVLKIAQKEMRDKADIYFSYRPIKEGKTVKAIRFGIRKNTAVIEKRYTKQPQEYKHPEHYKALKETWLEYIGTSETNKKTEEDLIEAGDKLAEFREKHLDDIYGFYGVSDDPWTWSQWLIEAIDTDKGTYTPGSGWLKNMDRLKKWMIDERILREIEETDNITVDRRALWDWEREQNRQQKEEEDKRRTIEEISPADIIG
jgi:plasmid replication initiation protein